MLRTFAVILLLPGCARLAVSLNRAERKGFNEAPKTTALARAQAQLIRRVLRGETHYDVLDLPANSTTDEIKAARDDLALVSSCPVPLTVRGTLDSALGDFREQRGSRLLRLDYPPRAPKEDEFLLGVRHDARCI